MAIWRYRSVYILIMALIFGSWNSLASPLLCADIYTLKVNKAPIEVIAKSEEAFMLKQAREDNEANFTFLALYDKSSRSIEIKAMLIDRSQGERSAINGHEAYKEMMEHFSNQDVRVIRGNWSQSDNSRAYINNVRNKDMSPEEAALNTWSGQQARAHGFTRAKVVFEGLVENRNGVKVYKIDVDFFKEKSRPGWRSFFWGR